MNILNAMANFIDLVDCCDCDDYSLVRFLYDVDNCIQKAMSEVDQKTFDTILNANYYDDYFEKSMMIQGLF